MPTMNYTPVMGRKKMGRKRIDITLPPEMVEDLTEAAESQHRDRSSLIEEANRNYLKKIGWRSKKKKGSK